VSYNPSQVITNTILNYYPNRSVLLEQASEQEHALLIVGGGITGCGIALDAQSRGIPTLLLEMHDIASGTSSRSTKLVHGGLRYLKQLEFGLVKETGRERAVVYSIAPHITVPEPMLLPIIKGGSMPRWMASIGTLVYDWLAGVKDRERRKVLDKDFTCKKEPLLDPFKTTGGIYYYEYRTDDARLSLAVARTAMDKGAQVLTYIKAEKLLFTNEKVTGIQARDTLTGKEYTFKAKQVVNAAGPWVETLDSQDSYMEQDKLMLTKGVHIVVDHSKFPIKQAVYFDVGDKRMVFAIPREGKTYIGTTDTKYSGDKEEPGIEQGDKDYLLRSIKKVFPSVNLKDEDIESYWSGLRPLIRQKGKSPSAISRKDEIFTSPSGLITIAGGKLTGYRKMAERVTDILAKRFSKQYTIRNCHTDKILLKGGDLKRVGGLRWYIQEKGTEMLSWGISNEISARLVRLYGSETDLYIQELKHMDQRLNHINIPDWLKAQLQFSIKYEMVCKPDDFMIRRTSDFYFRRSMTEAYSLEILQVMQILLNWSEEQFHMHKAGWNELLKK
jgi:glycerol-3-phosphate dehydrogenase